MPKTRFAEILDLYTDKYDRQPTREELEDEERAHDDDDKDDPDYGSLTD